MNLLPGQDVLTVPNTPAKLEAQLRCLGCGYLPEPVARQHIAAGRLVVKATERMQSAVRLGYAWRTPSPSAPGAARKPQVGLALRWWLDQLDSPTTRKALLEKHGSAMSFD